VGALGCGVVALILVLLTAWGILKVMRMPGMRSLLKEIPVCQKQMVEIYKAADRYKANHHSFPADLKDLVPDYLASSRMLHCPADPDPAHLVSYTYSRPTEDAPPNTIFLACKHHKLPNGVEIPLRLQKNGQFERRQAQENRPRSR